jgi:3-(3-hydroxy-phenyl)propionate hydroxylase
MAADTPASADYEVAIVGYGPVGATVANLLGRSGIKTVVVERQADIFDQPRAIGFDHEIMRIFQSAGLAETVLPATSDLRPTRYLGAQRQVIRRFDRVSEPFPFGWYPNYTFDQPMLEAGLRRGAEALPTVDVFLRHEVHRVAQDETGVVLTVEDLTDNATRSIRADYLVACDGANSPIRQSLGIAFEDLDFNEQWIVIDVYANDVEKLPQTNLQICDPTRPSTYIVGPRNHRRWEMMLMPGETAAEIDRRERIHELLAPWGTPEEFEIRRSAVYRFHARVAAEWRRARILLAGDAAHQTPPFIGQGMCQGIRDAANLCWKLKGVLGGVLTESVLDSYQTERVPHVVTTTNHSKSLGQEICMLDPVKAAERDRRVMAESDGGQKVVSRQALIPGLTSGLIDRAADGSPRGPAGSLVLQPKVRTSDGGECLMDDAVPAAFSIVLAPSVPDPDLSQSDLEFWQRIGGELVRIRDPQSATEGGRARGLADLNGLLTGFFDERDLFALVVRPDRYIYGAAEDAEDLSRLIRDLRHALAQPHRAGERQTA